MKTFLLLMFLAASAQTDEDELKSNLDPGSACEGEIVEEILSRRVLDDATVRVVLNSSCGAEVFSKRIDKAKTPERGIIFNGIARYIKEEMAELIPKAYDFVKRSEQLGVPVDFPYSINQRLGKLSYASGMLAGVICGEEKAIEKNGFDKNGGCYLRDAKGIEIKISLGKCSESMGEGNIIRHKPLVRKLFRDLAYIQKRDPFFGEYLADPNYMGKKAIPK